MSLKVLFIGGTGNISLPCVAEAVKAGHRVSVFNRGKTSVDLPPSVTTIAGDLKDAAYRELGRAAFDVVCQFITFTPEQMADDIKVFAGGTGQFIFISSASVYEKPPRRYVITEETPTVNPFWTYSQNKIGCETLLKRSSGLPWTIVRPSHTVRLKPPAMFNDGDADARRMLAGKPVILAGDGATVWTLTRCADFATPFVNLFGVRQALGEDFHITRITPTRGTTSMPRSPTVSGSKPISSTCRRTRSSGTILSGKAPSWATKHGRLCSTTRRSSGWRGTSLAKRTWRVCSPSPFSAFRRAFPSKEPRPTSLICLSIESRGSSES
jgi:uncharacterized protein YbjT (DUF2867 family)